MARQHALLSPSSAHRWLNCTVSAYLERQFPDGKSESADEGTAAHDLAEVEISRFFRFKTKDVLDKERAMIQERKNSKGEPYWSRAMDEYVDEYVSYVTSRYLEAQERDSEASLLLERQVNLQNWVPQGSGYCDAVILSNDVMEVIDFKYGKGVKVEAEDNPQLRLYALGASAELSWLYDIKTVVVTIVQPRNGGISSETISMKDLLAWGESIRPIAKLAAQGEGDAKAGDHCIFCRAAPRCKALAEYHQEIARHRFQNPDLLTDDELVEVLGRLDSFTTWADKVKEYALHEAVENKKKWPGWKLVEGRSNRKISDEAKAIKILEDEGFNRQEILKPQEIKGITNLEKLVGVKKLSVVLKDVIIKPAGKPTLVPEDDPRPEFNSPKNAFKPVEEDEIPF